MKNRGRADIESEVRGTERCLIGDRAVDAGPGVARSRLRWLGEDQKHRGLPTADVRS